MKPAQLLENFGVIGRILQDSIVRILRVVKLVLCQLRDVKTDKNCNYTHVLLLLMHMANLEPDIVLGEWRRRRADNEFEALSIA